MLLPLLLLSLSPQGSGPPPPEFTRLGPEALAEFSGLPARDRAWCLAPGQHAQLDIPAPLAFRSLGLWWHGDLGITTVQLLDHTFHPEAPWRVFEAEDLAPERVGPSGTAGDARIAALTHGRDSACLGLRLSFTGPLRLEDLTLVWIPTASTLRPSSSGNGNTGRSYPKPPINSRASWGAVPPVCNLSYCTVTHLGIHHTASPSEYTSTSWAECAANVLATQTYHMVSRGWCDIGYNFLVCVHGQLWEGRAGGDDVRGAHDGFNCGSMGTAFMGYFHPPYSQVPTQAMLDAYEELGAWKCDQRGIDPWGSGWYAGYGAVMTNVYGHRDVKSTSCPGDLLYADLDEIRGAIDQRLQGGGGISLILDTDRLFTTGSWNTGTMSTDKFGPDYLWADSGATQARAWWVPNLPQAGRWEVSLWWPQGSNRSPTAKVGLLRNGVLLGTTTVDQRIDGGQWNVLGTVWLPAGSATTLGLSNEGLPGSVVIADALRLVRR